MDSAAAANMMLVQCQSHSRVWQRPAAVQTTASAGPRKPPIGQATGSASSGQTGFGAASGWKVVPSTQIRLRMTAMRRASASIAIFRPRRCASWTPHTLSHVDRPRFIITVAAWQNARLRLMSPALVTPPDTSRSTDWLRESVRPTQGPILFEDRKRAGSSTAARKVSATTAPIPGIVMKRW